MPQRRHLDDFIEADGGFTPPQLSRFQTLGDLEGLCPLCYPLEEKPHNEAYLKRFPNGMEVHICEDCNYAIAEMESLKLDREDPEEDMFQTLRKRRHNILQYLTNGKIPYETMYRIHGWPHDKCGMCHEDIDFNMQRISIRVPVNTWDQVGGRLPLCGACSEEIDYQEVTDFQDTCKRCQSSYPVTADEFDNRTDAESLGQHLCGDCYGACHGLTKPRFLPYQCIRCKEDKVLDISLYEHIAWKGESELKIVCKSCATAQIESVREEKRLFENIPVSPETNEVFIAYPYDEDLNRMLVVYEEMPDQWGYVYQLKTERGFKILALSKQYYSTGHEAAFSGTSHIRDKFPLPYSKQTKIKF